MSNTVHSQFTFNYKDILIEEVALEGLEGITIELLWKRIEKRISRSLTKLMMARLWNFTIKCKEITFYELPEPRPCLEIIDRIDVVTERGMLSDPNDYLDGPFTYCPINDERGSCMNYDTRKLVAKENCSDSSLDSILSFYGSRLVLVASRSERWKALAPHLPEKVAEMLSPLQYCIVELIGRARENGQATVGKTNLTKAVNNAQLFSIRRHLLKLDIVQQVQVLQQFSWKFGFTYILTLKRFHQPAVHMTPAKGKFVELISYLKTRPNFKESADIVRSFNFPLPDRSKGKRKKMLSIRTEPKKDGEEEEPPTKKRKRKVKRPAFVQLDVDDDEESDEEIEVDAKEPVKQEHYVKVNIFRQAYELILKSGTEGLSGRELRQKLGVGFYTGRQILRWFELKGILDEIMVDCGRQRFAKFVIKGATPTTSSKALNEEKQKLLNYFLETSIKIERESFSEPSNSYDGCCTPPENISQDISIAQDSEFTIEEMVNQPGPNPDSTGNDSQIKENATEIGGCFKELLKSKKKQTARHIKFANAILKITREQLVVVGFKKLSTLAAQEINEVPMNRRVFLKFIHRLARDCQVKIYDLKWSTSETLRNPQSVIMICSPNIKQNDPIIKAKFREFTRNIIETKTQPAEVPEVIKKEIICNIKVDDKQLNKAKPGNCLNLCSYSMQRYRKVQRLHEFLFSFVYGRKSNNANPCRPGCVMLSNFIPYMTIRLALGHFSKLAMRVTNLSFTDESIIDQTLNQTTLEVHDTIMKSKYFRASLYETINILASFGLLQICHPRNPNEINNIKGSLNKVVYVNRNAFIIDTRGDWPRHGVDLATLERRFRLETEEDVQTYWNAVYDTATNTKVAMHSARRHPPQTDKRTEREAPKFDKGTIYGDGGGACGFDSIYYLELPRTWEVVASEMFSKENKTLTRKSKARKKIVRSKKQVTVEVPQVSDSIIKKRNSVRLKWSSWEDDILTLCKAAITILSPVKLPHCTSIRNSVAKVLINKKTKPPGICHRRLAKLEHEAHVPYKRECLINEYRRRKDIVAKYDGLLRKLKVNTSATDIKVRRKLELITLELVYLLYKISRSSTYLNRTPCVASSLDDFNERYDIKTASQNRASGDNTAPGVQTVKEAIMMAMTSTDHIQVPLETSLKVYNCLASFDETFLRSAVEQLRNAGLIAAKEKLITQQLGKLTIQDLINATSSYMKAMSAFKLSANYRRKLSSGRLNSRFSTELADTLINASLSGRLKGSHELNCLSFEMCAVNAVDIVTVEEPTAQEVSPDGPSTEDVVGAEETKRTVVTPGYVELKMTTPDKPLTELFEVVDFEPLLQMFVQRNIIKLCKGVPPRSDKILNYLRSVGEQGAQFEDVLKIWSSDRSSLIRKLERLEKEDFIAHVGYMDNLIVLSEFVASWTIKVNDNIIVPCPWVSGDLNVNKKVFMKWCGTIVNKIFEFPGISMSKITLEHFEFLSARFVVQSCEFLEGIKCVNLYSVCKPSQLDLFSEDDTVCELVKYCKFDSMHRIIVFPVPDMVTRFSYYKSLILDEN